MWIMSKEGFYSIVKHRGDPTKLIIRSRVKKDIENVLEFFIGSDYRLMHTPDADYAYRTIIDVFEWPKFLEELTMDIEYYNFKNTIAAEDPERAYCYGEIWYVLRDLQKP